VMSLGEIFFSLILCLLVVGNDLQLGIYASRWARANCCSVIKICAMPKWQKAA
jgi:hypothetical protein